MIMLKYKRLIFLDVFLFDGSLAKVGKTDRRLMAVFSVFSEPIHLGIQARSQLGVTGCEKLLRIDTKIFCNHMETRNHHGYGVR